MCYCVDQAPYITWLSKCKAIYNESKAVRPATSSVFKHFSNQINIKAVLRISSQILPVHNEHLTYTVSYQEETHFL